MRTLIVGEAPSRTSSLVLEGRCGERLAKLAGLDGRRELARAFALENLLDEWPGPSAGGKGSHWPRREAWAAAAQLLERSRRRRIILLGTRVADAFGIRAASDAGYCRWVDYDGRREVAIVPHPSGVCRWWNDPANVRRARRFMRAAARA